MVTNLFDAVQKNLRYPPLAKVDPNTQDAKDASKMAPEEKLAQAAIPAVLVAMIKLSDGPGGISLFSDHQNSLQTIYSGKEREAIQKVADYASVSIDEAQQHMDRIGTEAIRLVKESVVSPGPEKLRAFMNSQRHSVLSHLPAAMMLGDVLNENTFDDRTNKMEGPVSGFMHKIENII